MSILTRASEILEGRVVNGADDDLKKRASDAADSMNEAAAGAADTVYMAKEQARDYSWRG
jgi:hypothetical protein